MEEDACLITDHGGRRVGFEWLAGEALRAMCVYGAWRAGLIDAHGSGVGLRCTFLPHLNVQMISER